MFLGQALYKKEGWKLQAKGLVSEKKALGMPRSSWLMNDVGFKLKYNKLFSVLLFYDGGEA